MDVPPTIVFSINNPKELINEQSELFWEETTQLNLPKMFTDTFAIYYKLKNGCNVGYAVNTEFASNKRLFIINPRMTPFFKPITLEQYIRCVIAKLDMEIKKDAKGIEENKANFKEIANNPAMSSSLPELQKIQNSFIKWVDFQKNKKLYYEITMSNK